jgi:shikimate dehydrogenase
MLARISGTTRLYGIFADPIAQVKAPAAFNGLIEEAGSDAVFVPFHVSADAFPAAVAGLRKLHNFAGFTLTIPHKRAAMELCDRLGPMAAACGAVNAVRIEPDGSMSGETFDGLGMAVAVAKIVPMTISTRVLLVGAGGAGRAIAFALAQRGVGEILIANRTVSQAADLAAALLTHFPAVKAIVAEADPADVDVVINATSLGLNDQGPLPFDPSRTRPDTVVADVVMEPAMTPVLREASRIGRAVVPGRQMLAEQVREMAAYLRMTRPQT